MKTILLTQGQVALVDDKDFEFLGQWKWCAHRYGSTFYAKRKVREDGKARMIRMHRVILDAPDGTDVDHIDGNGLNNMRYNIRLCSVAQNQQNAKKQGVCTTSRYKGVSWSVARGKWQVSIRVSGLLPHLGCFTDEVEAALVYNEAAIKHFGQFAKVNVVEVI